MVWKTIGLTDPLTTGEHVKTAQRLLVDNQFQDFKPGEIDGEYGPITAQATNSAKWLLGMQKKFVNDLFGPSLHDYLSGAKKLHPMNRIRRQRRLKAGDPLHEGQALPGASRGNASPLDGLQRVHDHLRELGRRPAAPRDRVRGLGVVGADVRAAAAAEPAGYPARGPRHLAVLPRVGGYGVGGGPSAHDPRGGGWAEVDLAVR